MRPDEARTMTSDDQVLFVIAIHLPLDRTDEQTFAAYVWANEAVQDLTYEMKENIGPGFRATLDVQSQQPTKGAENDTRKE
jgi:hypothetical protein